MAKRKKKRRRPTQSKAPRLNTSRHTNLPRFLTMLAIGLAVLAYGMYLTGRGIGMLGAEPPAAEAPSPADAPTPQP